MDFSFSDEQLQLRDTLDRYIRKEYSFEKRRQMLATQGGFNRAAWAEFADLGLLGVALPEAHGGLGGGAVDTLIVMQALGRGLVVEPYLSTVVLCGGLLRDTASEDQQAEWLPAIASGERVFAFAHGETDAGYELSRVATQAHKTASGYTLRGQKTVVLHGGNADALIVSARTSGDVDARDGISLFCVN